MTMTLRSRSLICSLAIAGLAAGCGRSDPHDQGTGAPGVQTGANSSRQTDNSTAAPDAQPQYGQGGTSTTSRIAGSAADNTGTAQNPSSDASQTQLSDSELARKVHVALSTGTTGTTGVYTPDLLIDEIKVTASDGVVTLTGTVGSEASKQSFEQRARDIEGVKSVVNQLSVSPNKTDKGPMPGAPAGRGQTDAIPQTKAGER
jgi:hyperosmotically inducible protein